MIRLRLMSIINLKKMSLALRIAMASKLITERKINKWYPMNHK